MYPLQDWDIHLSFHIIPLWLNEVGIGSLMVVITIILHHKYDQNVFVLFVNTIIVAHGLGASRALALGCLFTFSGLVI